jgi:hypothetical protein
MSNKRIDYSRAATVLQPTEYPESVPKGNHLEEVSSSLDGENTFKKAPLTMSFFEGRNSVGIQMQANTGSGEECTGLNDGSKNSVATTYLTDAWFWGAEIFCGCHVQFVEEDPGGEGYIVDFVLHGNGQPMFGEEFKTQLFWVKAVSSELKPDFVY